MFQEWTKVACERGSSGQSPVAGERGTSGQLGMTNERGSFGLSGPERGNSAANCTGVIDPAGRNMQ